MIKVSPSHGCRGTIDNKSHSLNSMVARSQDDLAMYFMSISQGFTREQRKIDILTIERLVLSISRMLSVNSSTESDRTLYSRTDVPCIAMHGPCMVHANPMHGPCTWPCSF